MTWLIVAAAVLIPLILIVIQVDDWNRDWTTNHAELEASAKRPELQPQKFDATLESVVDAIDRWAASDSAWQVVSTEEDSRNRVLKLTRTTRVFRFVDDITVRLSVEDDSRVVTLHAESQSRVGKGDLGQNPRNLIALVRGVRGELSL